MLGKYGKWWDDHRRSCKIWVYLGISKELRGPKPTITYSPEVGTSQADSAGASVRAGNMSRSGADGGRTWGARSMSEKRSVIPTVRTSSRKLQPKFLGMCGKFPSSDISISRFLHIILTNRKMFHPQSNICVGQIGQTIFAFLTHPAIVGEIPIAGHRRFAVLRGQRNKAGAG